VNRNEHYMHHPEPIMSSKTDRTASAGLDEEHRPRYKRTARTGSYSKITSSRKPTQSADSNKKEATS